MVNLAGRDVIRLGFIEKYELYWWGEGASGGRKWISSLGNFEGH